MFASGTSVVFEEVPETVKLPGGVSASPIVKGIGEVVVFSFVDWAPIAVIVGGVFAAFTVRTKSMDALSVPSLTVTVIVAVPLKPGAGVITMARSAPLPLMTMLALGTSVVFEEVPETVKSPGRDSASPIVNAIGEVGVS